MSSNEDNADMAVAGGTNNNANSSSYEEDNDDDNFIDLDHAVEVGLNNDDDLPMDDEMQTNGDNDDNADNDPNEDADNGDEPMMDDNDERTSSSQKDMSFYTFTSHKPSSVFTVDSYLDEETNTLTIISGGGDDKAFLHKIHDMPISSASSSTTTSTTSDETINIDIHATSTQFKHTHTDSVSSVATNQSLVTSDLQKTPKYVAVGAYDGNIVLYSPDDDSEDGATPIHVLDGPTDVEFVAFHPKGGSVLLAGSITDATVWMYHLPTFKCLQVFVGHECNGESGGVTGGCFTPDGKFALTIGMDGSMRIWAPKTGVCRHVFKLQQSNDEYGGEDGSSNNVGLTCLAVDGGADGKLAIAGGVDGSAYVVHLQGKKLVATLRHYEINSQQQQQQQANANANGEDDEMMMMMMMMASVEAVGFASKTVNPNWVATGGSDGKLKIWDLTFDGGQCRQTCQVVDSTDNNSGSSSSSSSSTGGVTRLKWHPTLPIVIATYSDASVRLWDARNGTLLHTLTGGYSNEENQINDVSVAFRSNTNDASSISSGGGNMIVVTGNDNGECKVFNVDVDAVMRGTRS